jgi:large subunit ribosomal protein L5
MNEATPEKNEATPEIEEEEKEEVSVDSQDLLEAKAEVKEPRADTSEEAAEPKLEMDKPEADVADAVVEADVEEDTPETDVEEEEEEPPEPVRRKRFLEGPRSMRGLHIGKVVVNISAGQSGEPLDKAMTILQSLTGQQPSTRRAKQTIRTFGIRKGEPIACIVTLRGERAEVFLKQAFAGVRNRLNIRSFDQQGNFGFGIKEHIDIPGQRYDPNLGIIGMDVMATVERPGYRVSRRRRMNSRVGHSHRVTREESIEFIKQSFGVEVGLPVE